jgi:hypothetical protein
MTPPRPILQTDIDRYRLALARCRVWLCDVLLWFAEVLGDGWIGRAVRDELRADLAWTRRSLRAVLFLMASRALRQRPHRTLAAHEPDNDRRGSLLRHFTRRVKFRGRNLREHVARLRDVIDTLDACAARVAKGLARGYGGLAPLVRESERVRASLAPAPPASASPALTTGPPR